MLIASGTSAREEREGVRKKEKVQYTTPACRIVSCHITARRDEMGNNEEDFIAREGAVVEEARRSPQGLRPLS